MANFIRHFDKILENFEVTGKKFAILITTPLNHRGLSSEFVRNGSKTISWFWIRPPVQGALVNGYSDVGDFMMVTDLIH